MLKLGCILSLLGSTIASLLARHEASDLKTSHSCDVEVKKWI